MTAWKEFPILGDGIELHLHPKGGTLFCDSEPRPVTVEQACFVESCDGTRTLESIMPGRWSDEYGDIKFLVFVTSLLNSGHLRLSESPHLFPRPVTGSRSAYIPPHISIELTTQCNLRCRHCYRESDSIKHEHIATDALLKTLDRLADAGLRSVELTGGEPLLRQGFLEILQHCSERFLLVGVLSNGTTITEDVAALFQAMGDKLLLSISLDGSTAEAHDLRRGVTGAFERTVQSIGKLSHAGIKIRVVMCVDEESFADVEDTLLLARDLGAMAFSYSPVLPFGRGKSWAPPGWNLDGREVWRIEQELAEKYRGFLSGLSADTACSLESDQNCGAGHRTYVMDPSGDIRPCPMYDTAAFAIGNVVEQTLEEVFGHPLPRALANLPLPGKTICGNCTLAMFCRYCSLRGFQGSRIIPHCTWIAQPEVQEVLRYRPKSRSEEATK